MLHPSPPAPAKFKKVGPLATFLLCGLGLIAHFFGSLSLASAIECRRHRSLERKRRGSELRGLTDGKCGEETAEAISAPRCPPGTTSPRICVEGKGGQEAQIPVPSQRVCPAGAATWGSRVRLACTAGSRDTHGSSGGPHPATTSPPTPQPQRCAGTLTSPPPLAK